MQKNLNTVLQIHFQLDLDVSRKIVFHEREQQSIPMALVLKKSDSGPTEEELVDMYVAGADKILGGAVVD